MNKKPNETVSKSPPEALPAPSPEPSPGPSPEPSPEIGPPFLISWNLTKRCNLKCAHCYLDSAELDGASDMPTPEALSIIDEAASYAPGAMLIMTGGEPLLRPDLTELTRYATDKGFTVVIGTNGTLLTEVKARELMEGGVKGIGISLDSASPDFHDAFRGVEGSWQESIKGIEAARAQGLDFQVQLTVTDKNHAEVPAIIELAEARGATAVNIFFLVCTGRGQDVTDITPEDYERVLTYLVNAEEEYAGRIMVRARCAPHFLRIASTISPESALLKGETSGCIAGRGYLRISPEGFVTPCPYIPPTEGNGASLTDKSLKEIWEAEPIFRTLRSPEYIGKCGDCDFSDICGGCRARALATTGELMGEDPWCSHEPTKEEGKDKKSVKEAPLSGAGDRAPLWTPEATERLRKAPFFLRAMIRNGVERYARAKGIPEITPEVMAKLRKRTGR